MTPKHCSVVFFLFIRFRRCEKNAYNGGKTEIFLTSLKTNHLFFWLCYNFQQATRCSAFSFSTLLFCHRRFESSDLELTCWMWLLVKSGSLLMICLIAELRESPTRALQARARIRSASVMGIFTDSRDRSTWRRQVWEWMVIDSVWPQWQKAKAANIFTFLDTLFLSLYVHFLVKNPMSPLLFCNS